MAEHDFHTSSSQLLHRGKIFALRVDDVLMPGDKIVKREVVEHYGAVAIVAMADDNTIPLIYQYRHPLGRRLWELPAGLLDAAGEAPQRTAARELQEEAGLQAQTWQVLVDLDSTPGFSDESVRVYLATGLTEVRRPEAPTKKPTSSSGGIRLTRPPSWCSAAKSSTPLRWAGFWRPTR